MLPTDLQQSLCLEKFFSFYTQIVREKERAIAGILPQEIKSNQEGEDETVTLVRFISQQLSSILEEQALTAIHEGGPFFTAYYEQAQYIMAALADEIFLNLDWKGENIWDQYLIETNLFGTQIAGTKIFEDLDAFLSKRDPLCIDIGAIYYFALALGFQGKYRGINDHGALQNYKNKLFLFIMRRPPELYQGKLFLFPEVYTSIQDSSLAQKLPNPRLWFSLYAGLIISMGIVGSFVWYYATANVSHIIHNILSTAQNIV